MSRIAVVDNIKLKDMGRKKHIQSLCPVNRSGIECMYFDSNKLLIDEGTCIGCGICSNAAPEAIHIINLPEELQQEPIHRYGKNEFALYNLPTPMFDKVVGIIGVNGIGKSTAIKILAGVLKPNLGMMDEEAGFDKLVEFFKGTEAQNFFEKVRDGEIKVSYKPQAVNLISKTVKGKVRELLKKVDEKNSMDKVVEELDLTHVLDHDIATLSGGELQRVAIAATVLKKANLYLFDEPSSYLDIKQRINVSRFIKQLPDSETAVVVIEHDIVILDYMTDYIHLMYGKEGCYGVVSHLKTAREGINTYLQGYMKDENVRFRDKAIKFEPRVLQKHKEGSLLTSWNHIEKKFPKFELSAKEGEIKTNNLIGVLGENGIGKTTFVKILADVIKPDSGEVGEKIKVSYKPQYIELEAMGELTAYELLQDAIAKYSTQLIDALKLEPLFEKKIKNLSGGELQRVAVANALSKDVDLYLLDEPSAYLDVEQRLVVAKVIREMIEMKEKAAIIVDHDLVFIDYLSRKLIVFGGVPAERGEVNGPFEMEDGMNTFLKSLKITLRRDNESFRPRINKLGSVLDREQKSSGKYYYG
jgi:ATP-binding cassette, sub-family E, member 1